MAAVLVLASSVLGFLAAVAGWSLFGLGLLAGVALWSGTGLVGLALGLAVAQLPGAGTPPPASQPQPV